MSHLEIAAEIEEVIVQEMFESDGQPADAADAIIERLAELGVLLVDN